MIATGLLWYDDDTRRPLAQKIADAAERFRERVGYEPTACQLNPALIPPAPPARADAAPARRPRAAAPAISLRLLPDAHLRPNYFFVGVEAGEPAIGVPGWHDEAGGDTARVARSTTKRLSTAKADTRAAPRSRAGSARATQSAAPAPAAVGTSSERAQSPATNSRSPAKTATAASSSMHAQSRSSRKPPHPDAATPPSAPARPALIRKPAKAAKTATALTPRPAGDEPGVKSPRPRKTGTPPAPIASVPPTQRAVAAVPVTPARKREHVLSPAVPTSVFQPAQSSLWASDPPPARPVRKRRTA